MTLSEFSGLIRDRSVNKAWSKIPLWAFKHEISDSWAKCSYTHINTDVRVFIVVNGLINPLHINGLIHIWKISMNVITGLIPLVWRSLVNILPDINGFPLLGVKWVSVRHGWISFYRSLSFWHRPRWGADMAVWLRSDTVKHVITVWWVLWQYDISCCWWIGTAFWLYYLQWVRFKQFSARVLTCPRPIWPLHFVR